MAAHRILCSSIGGQRKQAPLVNPEQNQTKKKKGRKPRTREQRSRN